MKKTVKPARPGTSPAIHPPVVRISRLGFSYQNRVAIQNLSLEVGEGELFGILGPNGSGKSTLFKVLSTLMLPGSGDVEIVGRSVVTDPAEVRRRIGVVFQSLGLDAKLTVSENLQYQGHLYGLSGELLAERIALGLKQLRLEDRRHELVESLSGGLQRRVELAKGMLHDPQVLLLDEPTTGLDPRARRDFWRFLNHLRKRSRLTVIATTHLTQEAEQCDRIAILDKGMLVAFGTPPELMDAIGTDVIALRGRTPDALQKAVQRKFKIPAVIVDGEIRMEVKNGARLIPRLSNAFAGLIESITVRKPTLEDVFLHKTGHMIKEDSLRESDQP